MTSTDTAAAAENTQDAPLTSLSDSRLEVPAEDIQKKLLGKKNAKKASDKFARLLMRLLRLLPVRNRVFFYNVRKENELEGNEKALEPYVKGKKVICSHMLPHKKLYKLKVYYYTLTSRVIVCDDYNRYLRVFPLKPSQRVVQLWHACGAFKKFGRYGTPLKKEIDLATHVQYNLISVSANDIRGIYADAFDVPVSRVHALGCPRTDLFFDEAYIEKKREEIFEKYPVLRGREVILYAPTFRDNVPKRPRTVFKPPIKFTKISERLAPDQIFVVCPHPVMKNTIVKKEFPNILEIRDFSTNDMMLASDLLVTDYSSVIFEYALLKKPMAFFCYDLEKYDRGFYLNYPDDLPGDIFRTLDELTDYLADRSRHVIDGRYQKFVDTYMSACDGHSAERIAALINDYTKSR